MGDIVDLDLRNRQPTSHEDKFNAQLIQDLARFSEGLATEKDIRQRYQFDDAVWESLGSNDSLLSAIENEKTRRIRSGALKKERAQAEVVDAPPILAGIMRNPNANERHKIDSIKALDALATGGSPEAAAAADKFVITINLGDEVLKFNKSIAINAGDVDPFNDDVDDNSIETPWGLIAIPTKKDGGDGEGHL